MRQTARAIMIQKRMAKRKLVSSKTYSEVLHKNFKMFEHIRSSINKKRLGSTQSWLNDSLALIIKTKCTWKYFFAQKCSML